MKEKQDCAREMDSKISQPAATVLKPEGMNQRGGPGDQEKGARQRGPCDLRVPRLGPQSPRPRSLWWVGVQTVMSSGSRWE